MCRCFALALFTTSTLVVAEPINDISSFVEASEVCSIWKDQMDGETPPEFNAATENRCSPLRQRLAELRTSHASDVLGLQRLSAYDAKGYALAELPQDVLDLIVRMEQCSISAGQISAGEISGDGSEEDDLNCGVHYLVKDLLRLRRHYSGDIRITTRLAQFNDSAEPIELTP
jgi:hypothetical protein